MSSHIRTRVVGDQWTWFTDYLFLWAHWTVNCEEGRQCQVGMGVFVGGEPRGEKLRFSPHKQFMTLGGGAIHIRVADGKGPCTVRLDQGEVGLITIVSTPLDSAADSHRDSILNNHTLHNAVEQFNAACNTLKNTAPDLFPNHANPD